MSLFADSSAIVTRYASDESDVLPRINGIVVSALARVEVASALWRKARQHGLTAAEAGAVLREFDADWSESSGDEALYRAVGVDAVMERAARVTASHELRAMDAIQLASALAVRDAEPECRTMIVLDERLRRAAAAERFDLLPA